MSRLVILVIEFLEYHGFFLERCSDGERHGILPLDHFTDMKQNVFSNFHTVIELDGFQRVGTETKRNRREEQLKL